MTDTNPDNAPAPADDATAIEALNNGIFNAFSADLANLSKEDLANIAGMRIYFRDDAPTEVRRAFYARQRLAQEMLDEDSLQS